MDDPARDKDGNNIWDKSPSDGALYLLSIGSIEEYEEAQAQQLQAMRESGIKKNKAVPYWSEVHKEYIFDDNYGSHSPEDGYCSRKAHQAATQHYLSPSTITLCPSAFGTPTRAPVNHRITRLRHEAPRPISANRRATRKQELKSVMPTAVTLFHELFHLVLGNEKTYPSIGETYAVSQMLDLNYEDAVSNPETYAAVAVAYDYTLNSGVDSDGNRVEFFAGYAMQGVASRRHG
ncbi:hypothetical protein XA68_10647 [Ophiocordyceps unilateralis]|uniref:Uncharacterized protein n=1 Tax=Ophiocordyceps unilateralis TaxID=268505 RepID=A0A2A9NZ76_OPHUN|nr:hypothetical protein XA68_10647 [Ophiocordyceps unilateralis]